MANSLDDFHSDVILRIAEYLNVKDVAPLMIASKRCYYLVHQLRQVLGVEMAAAASSPGRPTGVVPCSMFQSALDQLRQPPTLAMCFHNQRPDAIGDPKDVLRRLPRSTVAVGVVSGDIQTNLGGDVTSTATVNVLLGHLGKDAIAKPFLWENPEDRRYNGGPRPVRILATTAARVRAAFERYMQSLFADDDNDYHVFFIYAAGNESFRLEDAVEGIQTKFPNAVIVGGICQMGYVSQPNNNSLEELHGMSRLYLDKMYHQAGGQSGDWSTVPDAERVNVLHQLLQSQPYRLQDVNSGVWGVALAGNVPVRSVVSRGVTKVTPENVSLQVESDERTEDNTYEIQSVSNTEDGTSFSLAAFFQQQEHVDFCGLRLSTISGEPFARIVDGFELHTLEVYEDDNGNVVVEIQPTPSMMTDVQTGHYIETLKGAQLDFFNLDGSACSSHLQKTMQHLKREIETQKQQVLAAIMVSCNGRGPQPGWLLREPMSDANAFHNEFNTVPLVGFYAGGEVGPLATAPAPGDPSGGTIFQRGGAALQGFTAVFALFIAPKVDLSHVDINDSPEHIDQFLRSKTSALA